MIFRGFFHIFFLFSKKRIKNFNISVTSGTKRRLNQQIDWYTIRYIINLPQKHRFSPLSRHIPKAIFSGLSLFHSDFWTIIRLKSAFSSQYCSKIENKLKRKLTGKRKPNTFVAYPRTNEHFFWTNELFLNPLNSHRLFAHFYTCTHLVVWHFDKNRCDRPLNGGVLAFAAHRLKELVGQPLAAFA